MILRLLLALLLVLPAGLSAGQHQRCSEQAADVAALDSGPAPHHESDEGHHPSHGASADSSIATAAPTDGCDGCDLTCKVSCAAVALPLGTQQSALPPCTAVVAGNVVAGLLNPHPLALLRPPAHTPA